MVLGSAAALAALAVRFSVALPELLGGRRWSSGELGGTFVPSDQRWW